MCPLFLKVNWIFLRDLTRDPISLETEKTGTKGKDRFEKLSWPKYEEQQQQYLSICKLIELNYRVNKTGFNTLSV